ncbi:hypothetical protein BGX27_001883 [Mortierella sp. AM989]|nr:hypothetical protein BGX27_001883 [Mortierella sp. AM989]
MTSTAMPSIGTLDRNSFDTMDHSQRQQRFIPIHEDMEERTWYIYTRIAEASILLQSENNPSPTSSSPPSRPTTIEEQVNEDRNQFEKESAIIKGEINSRGKLEGQEQEPYCNKPIFDADQEEEQLQQQSLQTRSGPNFIHQSEHSIGSRPSTNVMQTNFSTLQLREQIDINNRVGKKGKRGEQHSHFFGSLESCLPAINFTTNSATALTIAAATATAETHKVEASGSTSTPPPMTSSCTGECQQITNTLRDQVVELAQALLSAVDSGVSIGGGESIKDGSNTEQIRSMALDVLKVYSYSKDTVSRNSYELITPMTTPTLTPAIPVNARRRSSVPNAYISSDSSESGSYSSIPIALPGHNREPMLQDSVSHFSGYRMSFPSTTLTSIATEELVEGLDSPAAPPTTTSSAKPRSRSGSQAKSRNSFLGIFGKNPLLDSEDAMEASIVGDLGQDASKKEKHATKGKRDKQRSSTIAETQEGTQGRPRRNSWFKTTMAATSMRKSSIVSQKDDRRQDGSFAAPSILESGSPSSSSSSSSTSSDTHASLSAFSSPTTSPTLVPITSKSNVKASRRFSSPFSFQLWSSTASVPASTTIPRPTSRSMPIVVPTVKATDGANVKLTTIKPDTLGPTSTQSFQQRHRTYPFPSQAPISALEPATRTATGSFFDSVSDDDSDTDDEILQRHRQATTDSSNQFAASARGPHQSYNRYQQRQLAQGNVHYDVYDRDLETDRDGNGNDARSEQAESDHDESTASQAIQLLGYSQEAFNPYVATTTTTTTYASQSQFDSQTLEGYNHQFDDAPPPSYHSLVRADSAIVATTGSTSSSSSLLHHPASATSRNFTPSVLQGLLNLLQEFEDHILDQFKTLSFREPSGPSITTAATSATVVAMSSHRRSWRSRHPETISSFAYILIELEQTGILPSALRETWRRNSMSTSSSTSLALTHIVPSFENATIAPVISSSSSSSSSFPPRPSSVYTVEVISTQVSQQDWLTMTGNATTESDLAKAMLILEQNCVPAMNPTRWLGRGVGGDIANAVSTREIWIAQVVDIANAQ